MKNRFYNLTILFSTILLSFGTPPKVRNYCLTTCEASVYQKPDLKSQVVSKLPKGEKLQVNKSNINGEFIQIELNKYLHKSQIVIIKESPHYLKMEEIDKEYIKSLKLSDKGGLSINELKEGYFELTHSDTITFEELTLENDK